MSKCKGSGLEFQRAHKKLKFIVHTCSHIAGSAEISGFKSQPDYFHWDISHWEMLSHETKGESYQRRQPKLILASTPTTNISHLELFLFLVLLSPIPLTHTHSFNHDFRIQLQQTGHQNPEELSSLPAFHQYCALSKRLKLWLH